MIDIKFLNISYFDQLIFSSDLKLANFTSFMINQAILGGYIICANCTTSSSRRKPTMIARTTNHYRTTKQQSQPLRLFTSAISPSIPLKIVFENCLHSQEK